MWVVRAKFTSKSSFLFLSSKKHKWGKLNIWERFGVLTVEDKTRDERLYIVTIGCVQHKDKRNSIQGRLKMAHEIKMDLYVTPSLQQRQEQPNPQKV